MDEDDGEEQMEKGGGQGVVRRAAWSRDGFADSVHASSFSVQCECDLSVRCTAMRWLLDAGEGGLLFFLVAIGSKSDEAVDELFIR